MYSNWSMKFQNLSIVLEDQIYHTIYKSVIAIAFNRQLWWMGEQANSINLHSKSHMQEENLRIKEKENNRFK